MASNIQGGGKNSVSLKKDKQLRFLYRHKKVKSFKCLKMFLKHILNVSQTYLKHISNVSQTYLKRILNISQTYLKHTSNIS